MNNDAKVLGVITQTTPPSTPLDTLKALVLRTNDRLDYVLDQMGGGTYDLPEELLDFVVGIQQLQYMALAEHVHVAKHDRLDELRHIHPNGYRYADGTPVLEHWHDQYGITDYYPRYDGDRAVKLQEYNDWVASNRERVDTELEFNKIVGIETEDDAI